MYDIVFISYQEPNAEENWNLLRERFPLAKRIHGIKGIQQAHIEAAKICYTKMFWVVDGDSKIVDEFDFDPEIKETEQHFVYVWRSKNPVNGLVYGYGGVKLLPRLSVLTMDISKPDMTTSISRSFKPVQEISNITVFNTDPYNAWKGAFRECVKLSSKIIDRQKDNETERRLHIWCTIGQDMPFGQYVLDGANAGREYGIANKDNPDALRMINDFDWLMEQFNARNT